MPGAYRTAALFLADQVVVSGMRFGVGFLLARATAPENYGAYALVISLLFVVEIAQHALVTWPLAVVGGAKQGEAFRRYVSALARVQAWAAAGSAGVALAAALLMPADWLGGRPVAHAFAAALLVAAQQAQEFCRRVMLTRRPSGALVNDALLCLLVLGGLAAARTGAGGLASERAVAAYGLGAAIAAVVGWIQIRDLRHPGAAAVGETLRESWRFGRFIVGSRIGESLLNHAQNFVLGAIAGAAGVAALQATRLLVSPLQVASFAALNFVLPRGAARLQEGGPAALERLVARTTALFTGAAVAYALLLSAAPALWLQLAYAGRYQDELLLRLCCALQVVAAARLLLSAALYVRRRSDLIMSAVLTCGAGSTVLSLALARAWGAVGVAGALLAGELVLTLWILALGRRAPSGPDGGDPGGGPA